MPSTIIGSSTWNTRGIVLSSQSAQEQVNGLVNVQVEYTVPASKQQKIDQLFYVDAPPPIWPSVVNRGEMLTNNLYMVSRSVERANGLVRVRAEYVSGLKRAGFRGYFLRETVETGKRATAYNYRVGPIFSGPTGAIFGTTGIFIPATSVITPSREERLAGYGRGFVYDERIKSLEFIRIGQDQAAILPTFTRDDVSSIITQTGGGGILIGGTLYGEPPLSSTYADLWVTSGPLEIYQIGQLSFEKNTPVPYTENWDYITPSVQIVTLTYRLSR